LLASASQLAPQVCPEHCSNTQQMACGFEHTAFTIMIEAGNCIAATGQRRARWSRTKGWQQKPSVHVPPEQAVFCMVGSAVKPAPQVYVEHCMRHRSGCVPVHHTSSDRSDTMKHISSYQSTDGNTISLDISATSMCLPQDACTPVARSRSCLCTCRWRRSWTACWHPLCSQCHRYMWSTACHPRQGCLSGHRYSHDPLGWHLSWHLW